MNPQAKKEPPNMLKAELRPISIPEPMKDGVTSKYHPHDSMLSAQDV